MPCFILHSALFSPALAPSPVGSQPPVPQLGTYTAVWGRKEEKTAAGSGVIHHPSSSLSLLSLSSSSVIPSSRHHSLTNLNTTTNNNNNTSWTHPEHILTPCPLGSLLPGLAPPSPFVSASYTIPLLLLCIAVVVVVFNPLRLVDFIVSLLLAALGLIILL